MLRERQADRRAYDTEDFAHAVLQWGSVRTQQGMHRHLPSSELGPQGTPLVDQAAGRSFRFGVRGGIADVAPTGRVRLDVLGRWLQDAAYADMADARLKAINHWIIRRCRLQVRRFPQFDEEVELAMFCSGLGRMWAERRSTLCVGGEAIVEGVALFVRVDPPAGRPAPLDADFVDVFGPSAAGRRVRARLNHPGPPEGASRTSWQFRAADLDEAAHVNNSVYWQVLEEGLIPAGYEGPIDAEIEYRAPAREGPAQVVTEQGMRWVKDAGGGELHASIAVLDGAADETSGERASAL